MYYLPIYVNKRRMHVVKLDLDSVKDRTLFSFVISANDAYEVFSLPSEHIQMICDSRENVNLMDVHFELQKTEPVEDCYRHMSGVPVYNVKICPNKKDSYHVDDSLKDSFIFSGKLGDSLIEDGGDPFMLRTRGDYIGEYILQFSYKEEKEKGTNKTYVGAIRICEHNDDQRCFNASLDFGSEASQIHTSSLRDDINLDVRNAFIRMVKDANPDINYWQGRTNDDNTLYKSIYHIHQTPTRTQFGDLPMEQGQETFIQSLLEVTASTKDLILLPNLKLIEQLPNALPNKNITFQEGSFMVGNIPLANIGLCNSILRLILCNFLAITMQSEAQKDYLYFTLLVPNIYHQKKIHDVVKGLYDDFNLLKKRNQFKHYKGIEINIVSESDASFIGVRAKANHGALHWVKDAHYLIVDAGKGTTDFSLLRQEGDDLANFCSLYRSGIPASGHVLTYAVYDALRSFFYAVDKGNEFDNIMANSVGTEPGNMLVFVSLLERFKIEYSELTEGDDIIKGAVQNIDNNSSLNDVNTFLENVLRRRKAIPGLQAALKEKTNFLTKLLKESIVAYAKKQNIKCEQVFLTGRAFKLKIFKDAVSKMMVEEGIIDSEEKVFFNQDLTKKICTYGATIIGDTCNVNCGSNMLGSPNLREITGNEDKKGIKNKIIRYIRKKRGVDNGINANVSQDFFYEGFQLYNVKNAIFSISGVETKLGRGNSSDLQVYYVGDGYIYKHGNNCEIIKQHGTLSTIKPDDNQRLLIESGFPYSLSSFRLDTQPKDFEYKPTVSHTCDIPTNPVERTNYPTPLDDNLDR